ncbi:MAG: outer membrane lipoprotein carrier protein LolA [Bryobacterales bacterium]|nr:outer membrane lipoprotein carrier protein LolA [Bryobacteraceae bacterium]MDW8355546.1 outer membrane lipoprotein carrier protein LolA [Bryobacterales bacterium]
MWSAAWFLRAGPETSSLDAVLAAMDRAAQSFRDVTAAVERVDYTAVIQDTSSETGAMRMVRRGREVRLRLDFGEPDVRTVVLAGRRAEIYYPKIQTVQVYDLSKQRELVDQFLLLGFGTPGSELKKRYTVRLLAREAVGGAAAWRLELTPKSAKAREHVIKIEMWVSLEGHPVRHKFFKPSGDYTVITYSNLRINTGVSEASLQLALPPGVKREYPQK